MGATISARGTCATLDSAENCDRTRRLLRSNLLIVEVAQKIFPIKTALQLSDITGHPVRTVESWLTGKVKIPSDAFIELLRSDYGRDFLAGVMTDATPRWWLQLKAFFGAIDLAVAQRIHRRKMKALLDDDYAQQIPFATVFQDEGFYSAQPAPARSGDRAMARGKVR